MAAAQIIVGIQTQIIQIVGDTLQGLDRNYGTVPNLQWPPTFGTMAANVMLPLVYPTFTPEVLFAALESLLRSVCPCTQAPHRMICEFLITPCSTQQVQEGVRERLFDYTFAYSTI